MMSRQNQSKRTSLYKDGLISLAITFIIWFTLFSGMHNEHTKEIQRNLKQVTEQQDLVWRSVQKIFKQGVDVHFFSTIYQPDVIVLLQQAQNPELRQQARIELYRLLYPYYQKRLRQNDGHFHLHFHTPDNHSFLRFHQPEKFGDDLSKARPSVVKTNQTLKPVHAFETGKIISGMRHIYPIVYEGKHLGSVEFGQKFESLRQEINQFNPALEYTIIYQRTPLERKTFKEMAYLYGPSLFSDQWLEEDPYRVLPQSPLPHSPEMQAVANQARQDDTLNASLEQGGSFARVYSSNGQYYSLCFTPIHGIQNQNMAYLVSLSKDDQIAAVNRRFETFAVVLTLFMLLGWLIIWRLMHSHRRQREQHSYLQSITHTINEGLIVLDAQCRITMLNAAAEKLLGYPEEALLGKVLFEHFVNQDENQQPPETLIKNATFQGLSYQGELDIYNKDQQPFTASVSSQPLYIDGKLKGAVISFYDITAEKQQQEALRIAATAFETQEGIMITDPNGTILRVNKAFTVLTGYASEDVVGQTPSLLNSGRQDQAFYQKMWNSLVKDHFWQGEIWNKRKDGQVYLEWLTITAVVDDRGNITQFVANFSDVTERHQAREEIQKLAFYDPLTKLPNRRLLIDRLEHAILYTQRTHQCGALFFIDLDNFKTLNDTKGHLVGDLLLKEVAKRLILAVRDVDTVSRIGGDEFVILLENLGDNPSIAAQHAEHLALKILELFNQPFILENEQFHTSPSIGVEVIHCQHTNSDELLTHADLAMYQAKKHGRNTIRFFDPQMQINVERIASLQNDLREALEREQFELYYQPQVNQHAEVVYAEALIRWNHPERGFVSPAEFIPISEESGQIIYIGDWVLKKACETLVRWQQDPLLHHIKLAVNVSAKQFAHRDFVSNVKNALQTSGARPDFLKLELTESVVVKEVEKTIETMNALRDIGVRFSMDDFGTGHSSLSYLKRLPLSQLKIDQSFIRDLTVDSDDATIVKTIIAMSNTLKLEVIAEGVETIEQREFLKENQCYIYQGYLFSRPLPIDGFENLVKTAQDINLIDF